MSNELPPISGSGSQSPKIPPARVEQVEYFNASQFVQRPGVLTAVGILSIVLGSLGLLTNSLSVFSVLLFSAISSTSTVFTSAATQPASMPTGIPYGIPPQAAATPSRMSSEHRALIVSTFSKLANLSSAREGMLDQLLAAAGDDPFPFSEESITAAKLSGSVSSSGKSADATRDWFITSNGRIEVGDEYAVFMSNQGATIEVPAAVTNVTTYPRYQPFHVITSAPLGTTSTLMTVTQIIVALLNVLLAGYLLYCGIKVVKDSPRGRRIHLIYAAIKIPMIILGVITGLIMTSQIYNNMGAIGVIPMKAFVVITTAISAAFVLAYPVAIVIIMTRRSVKAYYQTLLTERTGSA